jgi:hypothetical protein
MSKSRFFTIVCISLLFVFVFACNKSSNEGEAGETSPQVEQAGQKLEQGEYAEAGEEASTPEGQELEESEGGEHAEEGGREGEGEHAEGGEHEGEGGEHAEGGEGEGEEAGPRISMDGTHDEVRKGSRLILSFDKESSSFIGTVENLTEETLTRVRIEVHLSNGTELGPTESIDLAPGKKADVKLSAEGQTFEWWKAHAEVGASEQ